MAELNSSQNLKIISRESFLALAQTLQVSEEFSKHGFKNSIQTLKTQGDISLAEPLYKVYNNQVESVAGDGKAFFTKELEDALLDSSAHLAVHSLKDMPTELPAGLEISALAFPETSTDSIISRRELPLETKTLRGFFVTLLTFHWFGERRRRALREKTQARLF